MYVHILFIYQGHLGGAHILANMNKAAMNILNSSKKIDEEGTLPNKF